MEDKEQLMMEATKKRMRDKRESFGVTKRSRESLRGAIFRVWV